jgi:uncharacterized protein
MEKDQLFVESIVKALVNNPMDVRTERKVDERGVLITLHVNPADMGYVIGKKGRIATAIRTLVHTFGVRANMRLNFKINEPEGSHRERNNDESGSSEEEVDMSAVEDIKL